MALAQISTLAHAPIHASATREAAGQCAAGTRWWEPLLVAAIEGQGNCRRLVQSITSGILAT